VFGRGLLVVILVFAAVIFVGYSVRVHKRCVPSAATSDVQTETCKWIISWRW